VVPGQRRGGGYHFEDREQEQDARDFRETHFNGTVESAKCCFVIPSACDLFNNFKIIIPRSCHYGKYDRSLSLKHQRDYHE